MRLNGLTAGACVLAATAILAAGCSSHATGTVGTQGMHASGTISITAAACKHKTALTVTAPAPGNVVNGNKGTTLKATDCIPFRRFTTVWPVDIDGQRDTQGKFAPRTNVTLDYYPNVPPFRPVPLVPTDSKLSFRDVTVGPPSTMSLGFVLANMGCAGFLASVHGNKGNYDTTVRAVLKHGCVLKVVRVTVDPTG